MKPDQQTIPVNDAPKILELASHYASAEFDSYSIEELEIAASAAGIPAEYISQAIAEIQAKNAEKITKKQNIRRWER